MTSSGNEQVIKTVAKKLKYYIDVKRLEDGFDLSGSHSPVLDHPPMKAYKLRRPLSYSRPTLQYGGLHDRPLKHYFSSHDVRVNLTQMRNRPHSAAPHEKNVKHRLKKYMSKYEFQLNGPDLPPVSEGRKRPKTAQKSKKSQNTLPEYFYIYTASAKTLRPEVNGPSVPLKSPKKKPIKGGWPILRTVPSQTVSRGEAERLVNAATKLLIATESVEQNGRPVSGKQGAPRPFETSVEGFPGIDEEESRLLSKSGQPTRNDGKRPATAKYTWDIHGRRIPQEQAKAYDDSYVGRDSKSTRRPYSSHPSSRPTSKRVYRHRSPTSSDSLSTSIQSSYAHSTSTSDMNMERLPPAARRKKKSGSRQSLDSDRSRDRDDRPRSARYHSQTIINVPEVKVSEDVRVQETTQTTGEQDEIGIQTETRLIKEYEPEEDEVKQGPWSEYQVYVRTGNTIGASTRADIKLTLYGELGRTKEIVLGESKSNKVAFQKGKEDLFMVAAHHVGKLRRIKIGHDRTELSNAWFLDSVTVSDMYGKRIYEFPCNQWLSEHDGDRHTYRALPADRDRAFVDALQSPRASQIKARARHETSEDDSYPVVVKHDKSSIKANQGKSGARGKKKKTRSNSEHSTDYESESDPDEAAVVSLKEKSASRGSKGKPKAKSKQPVKAESRTRTGPTFTFRSKDGKKSATRRQGEEVEEDEGEDEEGRKKGQEEYLAGYKAAITAVSSENQKKDEEEREKDKKVLRGESVHDAARRGHLDRLKELLQHFPEMKDSKDESGWTPLHHSSANGHIDVVKWLTTSGVDLNMETRTGYTPIHVAAMNGHVNAMMVLSAMGAAITCRTVDQQTPLHLAARGGFLECVKWLVANRARIDTEDSFKRTPIDMADEYQQDSVTDFLRVCQKELKNPHSSFSQMQGGQSSNKEANWKDDKVSNTSHSAAAGSDDDSSISVKQNDTPDLKEKRRIYEEQHHKMEESGMSFLDSIRQEVD